VYLGTISYTVYLSHHVIVLALAKHWPGLSWGVATLAGLVLTLLIAEPTRRWIELPCARLRRQLHRATVARNVAPPVIAVGSL
jgi:peptidoglycan/LPS O-acetylase OafA/YrhL